jgi:O-antigen ligase
VGRRSDKDFIARLISVFTLAFALLACVGYLGALTGARVRLDAGLPSPNVAADAFAILALLNASTALRGVRGKRIVSARAASSGGGSETSLADTALPLVAFVAAVTALLLTASRAGIAFTMAGLFLFAGLSLIGLLRDRRRSRAAGLGLAVLGLATLALVYTGADFALLRSSHLDTDALARRVVADAHWQLALERPIFGHGLNSFHELNAYATTPENWWALHDMGAAHNIYIQAFEETGAVGLALWVLMIAPIGLRALWSAVNARSGAEWSAGALCALVVCLLHGSVDFGLQVWSVAALLAFLLGGFAGARQEKSVIAVSARGREAMSSADAGV